MDDPSDEMPVLVARKSYFDLPTACPSCLPVYFYLRFANVAFNIHFNKTNPDSDRIPYVEIGDYVAFNNEKGGVIETLKEDGIVDLDSKLGSHSLSDWLSAKALVSSWLRDASLYELWVVSDRSVANQIYFSDLPWPIAKLIHWKQVQYVQQLLGLTKENAEEREAEIYKKSSLAYEALSMRLGDQPFLFACGPTSLDALFLGHALFVLHISAMPCLVQLYHAEEDLLQSVTEMNYDTSMLRKQIMMHENLLRYAETLRSNLLEAGSSSSSSFMPRFPQNSRFPHWSSRAKSTPKKEKTEEEKTFRRRAKYFLASQLIAVLVFLSLMGGSDDADAELDDGSDVGLNNQE